MSILLIEVVPCGIVFGADKNVTRTTDTQQSTRYLGQYQRSKIVSWPRAKALAGYIGAAKVGGKPTDQWLRKFIETNPDCSCVGNLAEKLRSAVEKRRGLDEKNGAPRLLVIMLAGFEKRDNVWVPVIWEIANYYKPRKSTYDNLLKKFRAAEVPFKYPGTNRNVPNADLKKMIEERTDNYDPWWIHQGEDLSTFNPLEKFLKAAFKLLYKIYPQKHTFPKNIHGWERQVEMAIRTYAAYFQTYRAPNEQLVGGGVNTASIQWPN